MKRTRGFHPNAGVPPVFLDWSFEHQFNSSSRTLSETIGKLVLLKWAVGILSGAVIPDKTNWKFLYWCGLLLHNCNKNKMDHVPLFLESKKILIHLHLPTFVYIRLWLVYTHLYSSSGSSTLVYTRLVTHLHSSTFVYIRLWLVYIRLHSSALVCVFRIDLLWFEDIINKHKNK